MKQQEQSSPWNLDIQFGISSQSRTRLTRPTKPVGLIASARTLPPLDKLHKLSRNRISGWVIIGVLSHGRARALLRAACLSALVLHTTSPTLNPPETYSTTDGATWGDESGQYILQGCLRIMGHASPLWHKSHSLGHPRFWTTNGGYYENRIPRSPYPLPGQGSGLVLTNTTNACCSLADAPVARIRLASFGPP